MPLIPQRAYLRIIDANFNRAKEALRVIEEFLRFALNHRALAEGAKRIRHSISKTLLSFQVPYRDLVLSRDSQNDVGTKMVISDVKRPSAKHIVTANFKRAEESLRVLEEVSKIVDSRSSSKFQALRFQVYELEKKSIQRF